MTFFVSFLDLAFFFVSFIVFTRAYPCAPFSLFCLLILMIRLFCYLQRKAEKLLKDKCNKGSPLRL